MVNWTSLAIPLAYVGVLFGSLITFSYLSRKRKAAKSAALEPWFPPHLQRDIYLSLLHHEQINPETGKPVPVPDSIIKAALLRRAAEDIDRIVSVRSAKQALATLLQRGSVGDDLWQRFLRGEQELEAELEDVVNEANALAPGWGSHIFQSANEVACNGRLHARVRNVAVRTPGERAWWNRRRETLRRELLEEVGVPVDHAEPTEATAAVLALVNGTRSDRTSGTSGGLSPGSGSSAPNSAKNSSGSAPSPAMLTPGSEATTASRGSSRPGSAGGSEEEAVLVEGGGPGAAKGNTGGGGGGKKKRRGKK